MPGLFWPCFSLYLVEAAQKNSHATSIAQVTPVSGLAGLGNVSIRDETQVGTTHLKLPTRQLGQSDVDRPKRRSANSPYSAKTQRAGSGGD